MEAINVLKKWQDEIQTVIPSEIDFGDLIEDLESMYSELMKLKQLDKTIVDIEVWLLEDTDGNYVVIHSSNIDNYIYQQKIKNTIFYKKAELIDKYTLKKANETK